MLVYDSYTYSEHVDVEIFCGFSSHFLFLQDTILEDSVQLSKAAIIAFPQIIILSFTLTKYNNNNYYYYEL
jgi:hypothetical protein